MTTTDVFQGMDEEAKPSSRVLRPPGGVSNFTIGGGDDVAPPPRRQPSAPSQPANDAPSGAASAAGAPTLHKPGGSDVDAYRDRLYGGGQSTEIKTKAGGNPKNMGTYNPITGKELVEPKEQVSVLPPREMKPVHTSTRVRQPPGGASSGLW